METELDGPGWRCLWPLACELGEGPVWDGDAQVLWFVDIEKPGVYRLDPVSGDRFEWTPPCRIGSVALRANGGMIAGTEHGFALIDPVAGHFELLADPEPLLPTNRFNDGKVDPAGHFWAGTMDDHKFKRQGSLYRLDPTLQWALADDGYRITNGPAFSLDGRTLYHNDTLDRVTYAFDLDDGGALSNKRIFVAWAEGAGNPDGMTTDAEDHLWQAFWGGSCVRRISPAGDIVAEHPIPASAVSSCAFGGAALDRLFVTTARQTLDADALEAEPLAGGLFEIFPGVRGLPAGVFAG